MYLRKTSKNGGAWIQVSGERRVVRSERGRYLSSTCWSCARCAARCRTRWCRATCPSLCNQEKPINATTTVLDYTLPSSDDWSESVFIIFQNVPTANPTVKYQCNRTGSEQSNPIIRGRPVPEPIFSTYL